MLRFFAALALLASPAWSEDHAGDFDYYVLSLSWSANWCALEGDSRNSPQCDDSTDFGWIMHGLWPQYDRGFPASCRTSERQPSHQQTEAMADIMGTSGLAWYQWNKHGVCAGLPADDYYALAREAYSRVTRPAVFRKLDKTVTLPASLIEDAFVKDNPDMPRDGITIICKQGYIQEARICLTRDLDFRTCGADVIRDCTLSSAQFDPMR